MNPAVQRLGVAACLAVVALFGAAVPAARQNQGQAKPPPQQQTPVFKSTTNFVQVDAYPTRDGRIIEGLSAKDFQILEDGKPQTIESVEFIRIEPNTPEAMRQDPNTQEEGNRLAADPRNRVFVLYLDHYHASLRGSHDVRVPLVNMLNRLLTPTDLFGVATPLMTPRDLVLGRQTLTIEDQLTRHWTWGLQSGAISLEPEEQGLVSCYGEKVALQVTARTREERTLQSIRLFMRHLGALREARKVMIVLSRGWQLYEPDLATMNGLLGVQAASIPRIGISNGTMTTKVPNQPGLADWAWCSKELQRAFELDNFRLFRQLIEEANRANVAFYPVNLDGLTSGPVGENLRVLAENTDGLVAMNNDFNIGLRKIVEDVSAFYLLGYYSSNEKRDGNFRRIDVKVAGPNVKVKARRGYTALPVTVKTAATTPPKSEAALAVGEALGVLSRLRPSAELFVYGVAGANDLGVVVELPAAQLSQRGWDSGADVEASLAGAPPAKTRIEAGYRGALLRLPRPPGSGPYRVTIKVSSTGGVLTDSVEIPVREAKLLGEPVMFRAMPAPVSPLRPAADYQYFRTERAHVEWPILAPLDRRQGRLLARDAGPLAVPVNVTERDQAGTRVLAADINLAPLAPGEYVIEIVAGSGAEEVRRLVPIRVIR